ncbi:hypothetical protein V8F33_012556 [Rhypophila sp. PSN 637]
MATGSASSIFEYLTAENPDLEYRDKKNATLTENPRWIRPIYVRPWEEFSFDTMERVFGGKLMEECRRARTLYYPAPALDTKIYLVETGHDTTERILTLWTGRVVNEALREVAEVFNPVFWVDLSRSKPDSAVTNGDPAPSTNIEETGKAETRRSSRFLSRPQSSKQKTPSRSTKPDGAGISLKFNPAGEENSSNRNRLPLEIKPGTHWTSDKLTSGRLTTPEGRLRSAKAVGREVWPIVQIYHYCVVAEVRYGFVITSKEAVVVRIKPMIKGSPATDTATTTLRSELRSNGLMEYKVIPWAKHRPASWADNGRDYKDLTINLSLWVLSLLAGNNCGLNWEYEPLGDEVLKPNDANEEEAEPEQQPAANDSNSYETPTEPSQSALSSFASSNPSFSFSVSASQLTPKPSTSMPLPSYVVHTGPPEGSPTTAMPRSVEGSETRSITGITRKRNRQTCDGETEDATGADVGKEEVRGRRRKRKVVL